MHAALSGLGAGIEAIAGNSTITEVGRPNPFKKLSTEGHHNSTGPIGNILRVQGRSGEAVSLQIRTASDETIEGSDMLVAAGRTPNTDGIGLDLAGVALDARGYVAVNDRLETSAPDVWAIGECAGSPQFTHVSFDDFRIIRANLTGGDRTRRDRLVPYCMFTDPPLARVGLSEGEAQRQGISRHQLCRVSRLDARKWH